MVASKEYGVCATGRFKCPRVNSCKMTEAAEWVERHLMVLPGMCLWCPAVCWTLLSIDKTCQDFSRMAVQLPCPVMVALFSCSSCFVLSHQEASRTALPSSLKFLTRGNRGLSETSRGCCCWERTGGTLEAIPYSISVVWEGFENGVSWKKLSFCFCGCAFFLSFNCKLLTLHTTVGCTLLTSYLLLM